MRTHVCSLIAISMALFARAVRAEPPARADGSIHALQQQIRQLGEPRRYEGPPLTLAAAVEEATMRNADAAVLERQQEIARARPSQERFLPPPTFEGQIWQWPLNTLNPANTNMFMFMAEQELPGRGKRDLRVALAQQDAALAAVDVALQRRDVVRDVKDVYAMLFIARKAIEIHLASVDLLRESADVAQVKYASGRLSQHDVLKAVVEVSKLYDNIIAFDEQAQIATVRLNTLMNRAVDSPIGPLTDPFEQAVVPPVEQLEATALAKQPELAVARQQTMRAAAELAVAKGEYKPDFSVQAGYMLTPRDTDAVTARFGITWPNAPWSRGRLDARVLEMNAGIEAGRARERAAENAARRAVREAYIIVKAAEQRASLLRTTIIPQAQQAFDVSRVAYQSDRVDFLALLDNERALLEAQLGYYRALAEFDRSLATLERAVGVDLGQDMLSTVVSMTGRQR